MAQQVSDVLQEHVVSLVAKVDQSGMSQLLSYLDASKLKSLGMAAAVSGLTTAIYKFVASVTKEEFALRSMAKQQHKTVEATRAQNTALKSMGMTLKEINKDAELKAIYNDIKKTNEALALPNMKDLLSNVNQLRGAFWKLKSIASYAIQWINAKILKNMEGTISRITGGLNKISDWFQRNFQQITSKIASVFSAFLHGIELIAQTVGYVKKLFDGLPASVTAVIGAIGQIAILLKSGPIGQLLAVIELIGAFKMDYENYQMFKAGHLEYAGTFGWDKLWDLLDNKEIDPGDKAVTIVSNLLTKFNDVLSQAVSGLRDADFGTWLDSETGWIGIVFTRLGGYFSSKEGQDQLSTLFDNLFGLASATEGFVGTAANKFGALLARMLNAPDKIVEGFNNNSVTGAIGSGVITQKIVEKLTGNKPLSIFSGIFGGILSAYENSRKDALKKLAEDRYGTSGIVESFTSDRLEQEFGKDERLAGMIGGDLADDFTKFIEMILMTLGRLLTIKNTVAVDLVGMIVSKIFGALNLSGNEVAKHVEETINGMGPGAESVFGSIMTGIFTGFATKNVGLGILGTLIDFLTTSIGESLEGGTPLWDIMSDKIQSFWDTVLDLWYGPVDQIIYDANGRHELRNTSVGLRGVFIKLWEQIKKDWEAGADGDGEGGFVGAISSAWTKVVKFFNETIIPGLKEFGSKIWSSFVSGLPETATKWMRGFGIRADSDLRVERSEDNTSYVLVDSAGRRSREIKQDPNQEITEADLFEEYGQGLGNNTSTGQQFSVESVFKKIYGVTDRKYDTLADIFNSAWQKGDTKKMEYILYHMREMQNMDDMGMSGTDIDQYYKQNLDFGWFPGGWNYPTDWESPIMKKRNQTPNSGTPNTGSRLPKQPAAVIAGGVGMSDNGIRLGGTNYSNGTGGISSGLDGVVSGYRNGASDSKESTKAVEKFNRTVDDSSQTVQNAGDDIYYAALDASTALGNLIEISDSLLESFDAVNTAVQIRLLAAVTGLNTQVTVFTMMVALASESFASVNAPITQFIEDLAKPKKPLETLQDYLKKPNTPLETLATKLKEPNKPLGELSTALSSPKSHIKELNDWLDTLKDKVKKVSDQFANFNADNGNKAWGGRIGEETKNLTVGEDGPEYIIPITKPERAYSLISQMLNEMGDSAIRRVTNNFGLSANGTIGASLANGSSSFGSMILNNTYNIHAPVSIVVNSSAASADDVGSYAYNMAERHLVRTLKGVYG